MTRKQAAPAPDLDEVLQLCRERIGAYPECGERQKIAKYIVELENRVGKMTANGSSK